MKKLRKISDNPTIKKTSSKNLLNILLSTKKFLQNNNNFSKKTNDTEESEIAFVKRNSHNELPMMPSPKIITSFDNSSNIVHFENPNIISRKRLDSLLFNSMSFDNFLKEVVDSRVFGNSRDILPPIFSEEKKDFFEGNDSILNINSSDILAKKQINKPKFYKNNNKKYLFCLQALDDLKINHRHNIFNQNQIVNESNKEEKYNISRNVLFRDIILNENSYHELYNDNSQYIMDAHYYNDFLKSQMIKLRRELPDEEDLNRTMVKEYTNSEYNKPILTLNSLSISFTCKGKYHLFHIPFELLPIFYYQNMTNLKYILISIIRFSNDYEDISIDYDEISHILSHSKEFELEGVGVDSPRKNKKFLSKELILKSTKVVRANFSNLTNNFGKSLSREFSLQKKPSNLSKSIKRNKTIRILNGVKSTHHKGNTSNEEKKYKCVYNKFVFKWNTPKYEYDVEVKAPEAILQIGKIALRAYVDIEYIFNFIENDFENWDYYTSQIIFSYKECFHYLNEIISTKNLNKMSLRKSGSQPIFKIINTRETRQENDKNNRNIFLNMEKIQNISEKSKLYEFLYTDENNSNYIKIFHNFSVSARCKSFKIKNKFAFDFNFFQMKILNKILRIQGLNFFLKKLIYIDKMSSNLQFGYDELNSMAKGEYNILEKHNPNKDASQTCLRMKEIYKDIINITITFPFLETIRYDNQNYQSCFESNHSTVILNGIPLDILDELCHKNFKEWSKILIKLKL